MIRYAIALHTTSPELGLALSNFEHEFRSQTWDLGRALSTHLHYHLNEFLHPQQWSDLSFIAVARGPGSFTGTRIGVVAARTLAQQLDIPLFAISTLEAFAWSKQRQVASEPIDIAVEMPAQRGEIFAAIYSIQPTQPKESEKLAVLPNVTVLFPDTTLTPDRWQAVLKEWNRPYQLITTEANLGSSATSLLELAYAQWQQEKRPHWADALPFYGQSSVT
ncbi:tRNA (adenosine(37)-N6)-threonylcarbamoyltransferase complex dimerization subunit type 1 TsaB [Oscillatoria sp. FACHB-1407]|uniref:tRNA (adenosine(37)-N6)-threonylcarbamoyltransferase complex dimerization subunit type 1 TsaB n=1 Tax=Oscillatoria sp. FACHB-1407 TaxID=2692847 RepID=UPI00168558AC|nr:tRNA (adenosine(37)-N6)-threonylcarbamoyltransferase complex dimerization subunit type 1 TsaB [Oscillatoria sp. FACHB-1407]MBD2459817.1 tRNA (adenosine(37)-N6)-threonylcarbamoyltransferase complex dimerization subunit type 1 TsaB [Oscillatoria sp. FACHB-1407]